jgi:protein TonB
MVPPPPRMDAPPPPFIPPPEVVIQTPPPAQPTITHTTQTPPPAPVVIPPVAPPVVAAAPSSAGPVNAGAVCSKMPQPDLPGVNITGTISMVAKMTIAGGRVTHVEVSQIRGTTDRRAQRALAAAVEDAVRSYTCTGDAAAVQEFAFIIT